MDIKSHERSHQTCNGTVLKNVSSYSSPQFRETSENVQTTSRVANNQILLATCCYK